MNTGLSFCAPEHFPNLAADVVHHDPDVILALTTEVLRAFKAATTTIPIVTLTNDPLTGSSADAGIEIWGKRLDLLREASPSLTRVGFLITRSAAGNRGAAELKEAAAKLGIPLVGSALESPPDEVAYRRAFAAMASEGAGAVFVGDEPEHYERASLIAELAERAQLPTVYAWSRGVETGGFMAYSIDIMDLIRHNAEAISLILKGAKPGDIPFYQATKFELIINLKAAKALGLEVPPSLLSRADEVIE